jgi:hypothetical protein
MSNYSHYVEHPRYGRGPRLTDVQTRERPIGYRLTTHLSSNKINGTAVEATHDRQSYSPVPVLYYFDLERTCVDCGRPFIFFAEEQKYWYEELGFSLDADCIRCIDCRKRQHGLEHDRRRYEELFHRTARTAAENVEMAECSLKLMENGVFHHRQTERVRMLLYSVPNDCDTAIELRRNQVRRRIVQLEALHGGNLIDERGNASDRST